MTGRSELGANGSRADQAIAEAVIVSRCALDERGSSPQAGPLKELSATLIDLETLRAVSYCMAKRADAGEDIRVEAAMVTVTSVEWRARMRSSGCRLPASCLPERARGLPARLWRALSGRFLLCVSLCLTGGVGMAADDTGGYPRRPVTIVVPYAAGGSGDALTRAIARQAQKRLGRPVLVANRPGGGGTIGVGAVARAPADGYTLAFVSSSPVVSVPNFVTVPYDAEQDFVYIARFMISAYPVVVRADSQWRSFDELLKFARANPGRLRWSTAGINGSPHIAFEAALRQEGLRAAFVPMQGSAEVLAGLLGNTLDVGIISDYASLLAAGRLRLLAEIGSEVFAGLEQVPTFERLGYPLAPTIFFGLAGPAGMSPQQVALWSDIVAEATRSEEFRRLVGRLNGEVSFLGHDRFHAFVLDDIATTRRTLGALGLTR